MLNQAFEEATARLERLQKLWQRERAFEQARGRQLRRELSLAQRVRLGLALTKLQASDYGLGLGGRLQLEIPWPTDGDPESIRLSSGDPVCLWFQDPEGPDASFGVIGRRRAQGFTVLLNEGFDERLLRDSFQLDIHDAAHTFERGAAALQTALRAPHGQPLRALVALLFGQHDRSPAEAAREIPAAAAPELRFFDADLNEAQRLAVARALNAPSAYLIHGPPGTGKTRTLVELIRQAVAQGQRVLVCAASNAAVDHLGLSLTRAGTQIVRLGHPARIDEQLAARSLDALLLKTEQMRLAQSWLREARQIRQRAYARFDRGRLSRADLREERQQASALERDARQQQRRMQAALIDGAAVLCTTLTGADSGLLGARDYDLLVIDEATQCLDPLLLIPLQRAARVVLAGDPEQLGPTVIDPSAEREGLGETAFERLLCAQPQRATLLEVQHRMHADLMRFPNETRYGGRLIAHERVRAQRLEELPGVREDPLRCAPLMLIDTAGTGMTEAPGEAGGLEDASTCNPQQAERTVAEVLRLLSRGLPADQLAVITPYRAQRRLLRRALEAQIAQGLEVDTVDAFQGREAQAIVLDLVRSNDEGEVGFVRDRRRLNVALTRAQRALLVIADSATLAQNDDFALLIEYVEEMGGYLSAWSDDAPPLEDDAERPSGQPPRSGPPRRL